MGAPDERRVTTCGSAAARRCLPGRLLAETITVTNVQNYMNLHLRFLRYGRYHHYVSSGHAL